MIYALEHNKISAEARSAFKVCQDTLTSSLFEMLICLFWGVIKKSRYLDDIFLGNGKLYFLIFIL